MGKKASSGPEVENLYDFLKEHFVTKQEVLDQFQQNEEKKYEDGDEDYWSRGSYLKIASS